MICKSDKEEKSESFQKRGGSRLDREMYRGGKGASRFWSSVGSTLVLQK